MTISIHLPALVAFLISVAIVLKVLFGFDYSGGKFPSMLPLVTFPTGAFLIALVWLVYFIIY